MSRSKINVYIKIIKNKKRDPNMGKIPNTLILTWDMINIKKLDILEPLFLKTYVDLWY